MFVKGLFEDVGNLARIPGKLVFDDEDDDSDDDVINAYERDDMSSLVTSGWPYVLMLCSAMS